MDERMTADELNADLREQDNDELEATYARLCTLERGHELYGKTADDYGPFLQRDLDLIEAEMRRRGLRANA